MTTIRRGIQHLLWTGTDKILEMATDRVLILLFFQLNVIGATTSYRINRAADDAERIVMSGDFNYRKIKRALYYLTHKGLIKRTRKMDTYDLKITTLGIKRLRSIIPTYYEERPWDGFMYLVSYDIPSISNRHRNTLRLYLRKIGCALLQESLWITPYNPVGIVDDFVQSRRIPGTILVSKMGTDGSIGDETLMELVNRVYKLDELSQRYEAFLDKYEGKSNNYLDMLTSYFRILKDDPQLPYELLPKHYPGIKAYMKMKHLTPTKTINPITVS